MNAVNYRINNPDAHRNNRKYYADVCDKDGGFITTVTGGNRDKDGYVCISFSVPNWNCLYYLESKEPVLINEVAAFYDVPLKNVIRVPQYCPLHTSSCKYVALDSNKVRVCNRPNRRCIDQLQYNDRHCIGIVGQLVECEYWDGLSCTVDYDCKKKTI